MSSSLSVKILDQLSIHDLTDKTEILLKRILNNVEFPKIIVNEVENGRRILPKESMIGKSGQYFLIGFEGCQDTISLSVIDVPLQLPYVTEDEAGKWVEISVGAVKSPSEFVLAAAVASAIAITNNLDIIDDGCIWNKEFKQSVEVFIENITVQEKTKDYKEAASILFDGLNFRK
jgi:hypothetical protein